MDLRADLVRRETGEVLWMSGGVWDSLRKCFVGEARTSKILRLVESQIPAARWFASWMAARARGEKLHTSDGRRIIFALCTGGRRGGKSNFANKAAICYAVHNPRSIVWILVPREKAAGEILRDLEEQLPLDWFAWNGQELTYTLKNGAQIVVLSSFGEADVLKMGRVDLVVISEAQKHPTGVHETVLPAIADKGGLVLLTANPPSNIRGQWVQDLYDKVEARLTPGVAFNFDADLNPEIDREVLTSLRDVLSEEAYEREIEGKFGPRSGAVVYSYSQPLHVHPAGMVPREGGGYVRAPNITRELTGRILGRAFEHVHGADFQIHPYMAATTLEFYADPDDPQGFLAWWVDECIVEQTDEDGLIDRLEAHDYTAADAVIPDWTGNIQGAERTKGKVSLDVFRRRGWRNLYAPDGRTDRNTSPEERLAILNMALRSSTGKIRAYVDPRCTFLQRAMRLWALNRRGYPDTYSELAHVIDAASYPLCRFFPRRPPPAKIEYMKVTRPARGGWDEITSRNGRNPP